MNSRNGIEMATEPVNPEHPAVACNSELRQPLSILDLLLVTLIVAVHLFHFPLAVRYRASYLMLLVPLIPTLIAIWIHIRVSLTMIQASFMHYVISVSWAFLYGVGYAMAAAQEPGSSYFEDPIAMGVYCAREMMLIAIFTTFVYAWVAVCIEFAKALLP